MENKEESPRTPPLKIVVVGPAGVGKSQICDNLTARKGFVENSSSTVNISFGLSRKTDRLQTKFQVFDTPGNTLYQSLLPACIRTQLPEFTLIVIDDIILASEDGPSVVVQFIEQITSFSVNTKIKLIVNKLDGKDETTISAIEQKCKTLINQIEIHTTFSYEQDVIYYSAKQEAEAIARGERPLEEDRIIQSILLSQKLLTDSHQLDTSIIQTGLPPQNNLGNGYQPPFHSPNPYESYEQPTTPGWNVVWAWLKPKFTKGLLFLAIAITLTTIGMLLGFGIGAAAGAWSGPGAFFTALAAAFAGAVTGWNLAILIAAPILGVGITGIGFLLRYRNTPPDDYSFEDDSANSDNEPEARLTTTTDDDNNIVEAALRRENYSNPVHQAPQFIASTVNFNDPTATVSSLLTNT